MLKNVRFTVVLLSCLLFVTNGVPAQTTQALVSGHVADVYTGSPAKGAQIEFHDETNGVSGKALTDASGLYVLPLLSPGTYRIRATANTFQAQEVHQLRVPVAG